MSARLGLLVSLALATGLAAAPSDRAQVRGKLDRLTARGDLDRALEQAAQARKSYPHDVGIHARYQDIRRSLGQGAQVREEYRRHWRKHKTVESVCLYARLLTGQAAVREYKRALRLDADYFWAHYGIGVAYVRIGALKDARNHLEIAQSLRPRASAPKIRLGQVHERAGKFEEALACYRFAGEVAPHVPDPVFHQVFALLALERHREARDAAARLQKHPAADAEAMGAIALGVLAASRGDRKGAVELFRTAVHKSTEYGPHALTLLGDTLTDLGRYDEAGEAYTRALGLNGASLRAQLGLGYLLYRRGKLRDADKVFAQAEEVAAKGDPVNGAEAKFFRGVIAEDGGRLRRALAHYKAAIDADGASVEYQLALAALYERMDLPRRALPIYVKAAELDPTDALPCFQAGLIEAEEFRHGERALAHLEESIRRDAKLLDAYLSAGSVCQDLLHRPKDALKWYESYVRAGGTDKRVFDWIDELK